MFRSMLERWRAPDSQRNDTMFGANNDNTYSEISNQLCSCDACLPLYREYLRQHKDDPVVKKFLGDADIETFDYGQYLRGKRADPTLPDWKQDLPRG